MALGPLYNPLDESILMNEDLNNLWQSLALLLRSHPWHGIPIGEESPSVVNTYIETVPSDTVKYEIDKKSGFLKLTAPRSIRAFAPPFMGLSPRPIVPPILRSFAGRERDALR